VKEREAQGFAYEAAGASFELLARRVLGQVPDYFTVERFSVNVGAGVGLRWRSPLGPVRVDVAFPVQSELPDTNSWRLHVLLGPDI